MGQRVLLIDLPEAIGGLVRLLLAEEAYRVEDRTTEGEPCGRFLTAAHAPLIVVFTHRSLYRGPGALLR